MRTVETIAEMRQFRRELAEPVGFFPTLGFLHEGHLSLVRQARSDNRSVVASIFVNPTQFAPNEDLASYPRDLDRDLAMLEAEGVDIVFLPTAEEMYPPQSDSWVEVGNLAQRLEGASRPTHFRGVTTVVAKLFNIVRPTRAYFGQKDAQQAAVIKQMVTDLDIDLEIVVCPTVREADGLAMSSRNDYLTPEQRTAAVVLHQALELAEHLWAAGERDAFRLRQETASVIRHQPLAEIDYISVADPETLQELDTITDSALVSMAVRFGKTRLLDNVVLGGN